MPAYLHIMMQYFYELPESWNKSSDSFMPAEGLSKSLETLLKFYPVLGGRLEREGERAGWAVRGTNHPIPFVVASTDIKMADLPLSAKAFSSTDVLPASLSLLPPMDYTRPLEQALLQVQHTRFACGGVAIGVRVHHAVMDGAAYSLFMRSWAELYRNNDGTEVPSKVPTLDPSWLSPSEEENKRRVVKHQEKTYLVPTAQQQEHRMKMMKKLMATPCKNRVFRFEAAELAALKKEATDSDAHGNVCLDGKPVSTFEALVSHVYRRVHAARCSNSDDRCSSSGSGATGSSSQHSEEIPRLSIAINARPRLHSPTVPDTYVGNATLSATMTATCAANLSSEPLSHTAALLHDTLAAYDNELLRGTIAWMASQERQDAIVYALDNSRDLIVTQWNKFHTYAGLEFESGTRPVRMCMPHFPGMNGVIVLYSTPDDSNDSLSVNPAIDMLLCLDEASMGRLEADPLFRARQ